MQALFQFLFHGCLDYCADVAYCDDPAFVVVGDRLI